MVIVGLLVLALACVIAGVATTSAPWLIASLIATAGAGYLVVRNRRGIAAPSGGAAAPVAAAPAPGAAGRDSAAHVGIEAVTEPAEAAGSSAPAHDAPGGHAVWVIDGRPRYHLEHCAIIKGQDAEPIPWEQATEDGFMPCSLCEPDSILATGG